MDSQVTLHLLYSNSHQLLISSSSLLPPSPTLPVMQQNLHVLTLAVKVPVHRAAPNEIRISPGVTPSLGALISAVSIAFYLTFGLETD